MEILSRHHSQKNASRSPENAVSENSQVPDSRVEKDVAILLLTSILVDGDLDQQEFQVFRKRFGALVHLRKDRSGQVARQALREIRQNGGERLIRQSCRSIAQHLSFSQQEQCLDAVLSIIFADGVLCDEEIGYFQFISKTIRQERRKLCCALNPKARR